MTIRKTAKRRAPRETQAIISERSKQSVTSRYEGIPAEVRPNWEVVISFLIDDVSRLQRAALDQILKPLGASRAQWALMSHISRHPGMKQIELAEGLDLSRVAVKLLMDRLLKNGIISASPDPADGRAKRIALTRKGTLLLEKLRRAGFEFLEEVSGQVSAKDRKTLIREISNMKQLILDYGVEKRKERKNALF